MNALAWTILILNAAPFFIATSIIILVVIIYRMWRGEVR